MRDEEEIDKIYAEIRAAFEGNELCGMIYDVLDENSTEENT